VSSYILVSLRLASFDYEHELAVRDLEVSCWTEVGIPTGINYKRTSCLHKQTASDFSKHFQRCFTTFPGTNSKHLSSFQHCVVGKVTVELAWRII
jgi:hypothetical protein